MKRFRTVSARHMVITPVVRLSFPRLFTPRAFKDDPEGKKQYSCDLIFESKEDLSQPYTGKKIQTVSVRQAITNAIHDYWGEDKKRWPAGMLKPVKEGNQSINKQSDEPNAGYADKFYISAKTGEKMPPKLIDLTGRALEEKDLYGGCYVRACIVANAFGVGQKGVTFYLNQIMKVKDGEPFGGSPRDVFDFGDEADAEEDWSYDGDGDDGSGDSHEDDF